MAEFTDKTTPAASASAAAEHPSAPVVDRWFRDHFPGSVVARDTEVWNHVFGAVADLKKRLAAG